ncbi:HEXXH motif-containing putative peptide modification protein [Actinoplanes sp. NPDC049802]|uniref:aKG-HExxH-type peptide beta-hydroxylase n=1 Tax=Actinoplanes sp. NPDC049802 TaxID=3154742 RepID=UPI0033FA8C61
MTVQRFRLSDAALTALGAGRPSGDTLGVLRRAEFSRHLLLLREVRRALPSTPVWYARIAAGDTSSARDWIADPMTGLWAAEALLRGPSAMPAPAPRGRPLTASCDGLTLSVRLEDADPARTHLGLVPSTPLTPGELAHWRFCLEHAWTLLVREHRPAAVTLAGVLRVIVPVEPDPAAEGISATSAEAFGAVAMSAPPDPVALAVGLLHETQHSVLNAVHLLFDLVHPARAGQTEAGSPDGRSTDRQSEDPRSEDARTGDARTEDARTEDARTEDARTGDARTAEGRSTDGALPGESHYSPWRNDPRPALGVLHGAYAYLAVTRFWRARAGRAAEFEFARWRAAVAGAASGLLDGGELTSAGARFVTALLGEVRPWLGEPVDPEVERLAVLAGTDHRLRWRLRNLTVEPSGTARLVAAWRSGRPAPEVASVPVPGGGRALENSSRLRLVKALLKGEWAAQPGGRGNGSDDACVRGADDSARAAYEKDLEVDRGDDSAWAGLALVSPHPAVRARPEVVRAVARAVPEARIADLADWFGWTGDGGTSTETAGRPGNEETRTETAGRPGNRETRTETAGRPGNEETRTETAGRPGDEGSGTEASGKPGRG